MTSCEPRNYYATRYSDIDFENSDDDDDDDDDYDDNVRDSHFTERSRGTAELQENYERQRQSFEWFFNNTFLFRGPLFDFGIWDFPHAGGGGGDNNERFNSAAYAYAPRSAFDGVDMTRRRCDKRAPFPIQQFHPQQETRWVIPHEIG